MEHKRDFVLLGTISGATYSDIFPHVMAGRIRLGVSLKGGKSPLFYLPDGVEVRSASAKTDEAGHRLVSIGAIRWITTFSVPRQVRTLELTKHYTPEEYPKYDNYDAIEVSKIKDIPIDYAGAMGVPVTFLDWFDPDAQPYLALEGVIRDAAVNGSKKFKRLQIRAKASNVFCPLN